MIRPLRHRHRRIVGLLGIVLPVAFVVSLVARRPAPVLTSVPAELTGQTNHFGSVVWTKADIWPELQIVTRLRTDSAGALAVELALGDLARPDVLVYWAARNEATLESLPDNARLLGALSNRSPLPLPADVRNEAGRLILYSLADHEVVAASKSFTVQKD